MDYWNEDGKSSSKINQLEEDSQNIVKKYTTLQNIPHEKQKGLPIIISSSSNEKQQLDSNDFNADNKYNENEFDRMYNNTRIYSVGLNDDYDDKNVILCGIEDTDLEKGRLSLPIDYSTRSGIRRSSCEGFVPTTIRSPLYPDNNGGEWSRSKSSPGRRRHSHGSETIMMPPSVTRMSWGNLGARSIPGSCEATLTDIIENPSTSISILEQTSVPTNSDLYNKNTLSPQSSAAEPFGTPCSGSPLRRSPLPPLQDDEMKKDGKENVENEKLTKNMEAEGANLTEGHTSREGLDPESLMFRDGRRKIDMVLAYEQEELGVMTETEARRSDQRKIFQENLIKEGLELELENKCLSFDEKTWFLKVHIPWRTETRYAEVLGLKLPIKRFLTISVKAWDREFFKEKGGIIKKWINKMFMIMNWNHSLIPPEPSFYDATAGPSAREETFLVKDRETAYTSAQRSYLVMQILLRTKYDETEKVGIRRLLNDGTYLACFPLHEGKYEKPASNGEIFDRRKLYSEWARPSKWFKNQPLWLVKKYFGDKIGLYFCWLGFYTKMLYAPAIVGTLCFIYGLLSMNSNDNYPTKEICNATGSGSLTLCPLCDKACKYQDLSDSCLFARLTYLFDNPATVFFAIFMSFWATSFLELWKRKQSVIVWEWDLYAVDQDEEPRPEFETSVKTFRINPVTKEKEPYLPEWSKTLRFIISGSGVLFMIIVVLGAVLGTIIYRISLVSIIYSIGDTDTTGAFIQKHAKICTTISAAIINLIIIMILTKIYANLAIYLTNLENPRTQNEYEDSYTFKIFFFEFMNFYSSLIYIAFFKGRFFDYPGDEAARRSEFFKLKGDICDPAGCLSELCIQLAIIMIGKQFVNNFLEILYPKMWNWWRQRTHRANTKDLLREHQAWEQDYHLQDPGRLALFDEYLEMILQYGFVTLFVAAFPLAPLFALINNIAEIRLDAYKMVTQARRPLAERVEDIGAWFGILRGLTYAAVVSNAFVIAYTSDWIPRMVYRVRFAKPDRPALEGYIKHSLSTFNTSDYKTEWGLEGQNDPATCFFRGYRNPPDHPEDPYGLSPHYWHVFAARLAFVVVFEHFVFGLTGIMRYAIPDTPAELKTQRQREALLAKEAKYEHELNKDKDSEYDRVMNQIRQPTTGVGVAAGSWARRLSRVSDGLDAHVSVVQRSRPSLASVTASWQTHSNIYNKRSIPNSNDKQF